MRWLLALTLAVLPGAWPAFGIPTRGRIGLPYLCALAVVLSPPVAAAEFLALRLAGFPFGRVASLLIILNFPALLLLVRSAWRGRKPIAEPRVILLGAILFTVVVACVAIPWVWDPAFRRFSWHGLLHTDIIYSLATGAIVPEETQLAGVTLAYPWMGHAFWAVLAWKADLSPTVIYLFTNIILLGAIGLLAYGTARRLGATTAVALATPLLLALGPNLPGLVGWSLMRPNASGVWWAVLGDLRYTPYLLKFVSFEVMSFGLAALAGLVFLAVAGSAGGGWPERALAGIATAALGLVYPILFPVGFALLLTLSALPLSGEAAWRRPPASELLWSLLMVVAVAAIALAFLRLYTASQTGHVLRLSPFLSAGKKSVAMALEIGPFAWLAWRAGHAEPGAARRPYIVLASGVLTGIALHILLRIGGGLNEYKLAMGAGLCVVPPAAVGLQRTFVRRARSQWSLAAVLPVALALVMVAFSALRIPREGSTPRAVEENSFWLTLAGHGFDARWTRAVRTQTPPNTIVIVRNPDFRTTSFTGRAVLAATEGAAPQFGFNMLSRYFLIREQGYDVAVLDARLALQERVYSARTPTEIADVLADLGALGRPLVIVFPPGGGGGSLLYWLREHAVGMELAVGADGETVRYLPVASLVAVTGERSSGGGDRDAPGAPAAAPHNAGDDR